MLTAGPFIIDLSEIEFRDERPGEAEAIRAIVVAAFKDAPHSSGTESAIVDSLRQAGALTVSLVAVEAGEVVGHAAFSPVTIDCASVKWFGLGPVSVRPDRQRRGIGAALIGVGLERLRKQGAEGCVALGEPAYYERFGFQSDPDLRYGEVSPEYFQLLSFTGSVAHGGVAYHPAFEIR